MKKIESFNGQGSIGSESQVHRLDYSRPLWIIEHLYDGYPDDLQGFNDIRSKFESTFQPKLNGKKRTDTIERACREVSLRFAIQVRS